MVKVGIIGIGGMGRMHYNCYKNNLAAEIVAICDVDPRKTSGDWGSIGINLDTSKTDFVDLGGIATYSDYHDLLKHPGLQLVDICLPTPQHAATTIAALEAGFDVLCEKPMAMTLDECSAVIAAHEKSGRQLMIGHCLRYWPHYIETKNRIASGEYGRPLYARFHRSSGTPFWSWNNWLATGSQSGGVVHDMHIHDVDTALWWFGEPQRVEARGVVLDELPTVVDAEWTYPNFLVHLHGIWDNNGGPFRFAFKVVLEKATIEFDSFMEGTALRIYQGGEETQIPMPDELPYQNEIDDFVDCIATGRKLERVTPQASRLSVATTLGELKQILG